MRKSKFLSLKSIISSLKFTRGGEKVKGPEIVDGYKVSEVLIARSGFGEVYRAEKDGKSIAVKVISSDSPHFAKKKRDLKKEYELSLKVDHHPHIADIYKFLRVGKKYYLLMEYVESIFGLDRRSDLEMLTRKKDLSMNERINIFKQIVEGLTYLHYAKGIIHGDIKPQNILISKKGEVKIVDFGLFLPHKFEFLNAEEGVVKKRKRTAKKRRGKKKRKLRIFGTPSYMAPEQLRGKKVDTRSDVYSLGVNMYELFTGFNPYKVPPDIEEGQPEKPKSSPDREGASLAKRIKYAMRKQSEKLMPPRKIDPKIPEEIERIILKCLEKEAKNRYASAYQISQDLTNLKLVENMEAAIWDKPAH